MIPSGSLCFSLGQMFQPFSYGVYCLVVCLVALCQICLGCAELEIEVDADGHVAGIVGDIEAQELLVLGFLLIVKQGENEAMVSLSVIGFPVFLATIDQRLLFYLLACGHGKVNAVPWLVVFRRESAGESEDGEHVVVAFVALVVVLRPFTVAI